MNRWLVFTVMLMMPGFTPAHELTRDQLSSYARDGYLVVKGLCQNSQFTLLEEQVQKAIDGAWRLSAAAAVERKITSEGSVYVFGPGFQSLLRIVWVGARYPKLLAMGRQPCLTVPVAQLLDSPEASHLINQIHPKLSGDRVRFDLHRDVDHRRSFDPAWQDVKLDSKVFIWSKSQI